MEKETVLFIRVHEREQLYKTFFHTLHAELSQATKVSLRAPTQGGRSWMTVAQIPGPSFLGFAFTRRKRFRVELYIDTGDKERNKHLFDMLHNRASEIQTELKDVPGSLEWERIDEKRASRIALYHEGAITDAEEELASLRNWAVDAMIKFQKVMDKHLSEVL